MRKIETKTKEVETTEEEPGNTLLIVILLIIGILTMFVSNFFLESMINGILRLWAIFVIGLTVFLGGILLTIGRREQQYA